MSIADRSPDTSAASIVGEGFKLTPPKARITNHQQTKQKRGEKNPVLFVLLVVAVELAPISSVTVDVGVSTALLFAADVDGAPDPPARVDS